MLERQSGASSVGDGVGIGIGIGVGVGVSVAVGVGVGVGIGIGISTVASRADVAPRVTTTSIETSGAVVERHDMRSCTCGWSTPIFASPS